MSIVIPTHVESGNVKAVGYATPKEDKKPQKMYALPKRVIPIVFLPGIMGSNLRMNAARQALLRRKNNIAWRPDRPKEMVGLIHADPAQRQMQLDPAATEVDINVCGPVHHHQHYRNLLCKWIGEEDV